MRPVSLGHLADYEVLLSDERLDKVVARLHKERLSPHIQEGEFVTFVQPEQESQTTTDGGLVVPYVLPAHAVLAVFIPSPRHAGVKLMFSGATTMRDWEDADWEWRHYAGRDDPAYNIYRRIMGEVNQTIDNLKQMN